MFDRAKNSKQTGLDVAVERGKDGYSGVWSLQMPGCYAVVPPGADIAERVSLAMVEFASWSHNRSAERATLDPDHVVVVQSLATDEDVAGGDTTAFFLHDADPASPNEFPLWANPHDLALDELRVLGLSVPPALRDHVLDQHGRTIEGILVHAAGMERFFADQLRPGAAGNPKQVGGEKTLRELQDAHLLLQQLVCDVPQDMRVSRAIPGTDRTELWSVRKVMRRSIWHLRFHSWEIRRALGTIWLGE